MSIPYLPGVGDTLAQYGPQIGKSLHEILNPDDELQKRLISHLAANPGLIDELSAQEKA